MRRTRPLLDVEQLDGGYAPDPVPPGFVPPPSGLPTTQVLETEDGPWRNAGKYGRLINVAYPASLADSAIPIFSIDRQLGPPRPRTLHLFRSDAMLTAALKNADFYASITYGVGGVENNFLCDWSRGGQISLVCDSLRVDAVAYQPIDETAYAPPDGTQVLGAMLSNEGSAPPRPPTFTTSRVKLATTEIATFAVPDFARWVYPTWGPNLAPAAPTGSELTFRNFGSFTLKKIDITEAAVLQGVQIPGGTTEVAVHNGTGADQRYLLSFQLGL